MQDILEVILDCAISDKWSALNTWRCLHAYATCMPLNLSSTLLISGAESFMNVYNLASFRLSDLVSFDGLPIFASIVPRPPLCFGTLLEFILPEFKLSLPAGERCGAVL